MKTVSIIGSTGSIGVQALNVIRQYRDEFKVVGLSAGSNEQLLLNQANEFMPDFIALKNNFTQKHNFKCFYGEDAGTQIADIKADIVIISVVGIAGLLPAMQAIKNGSRVALANKEALVCAGKLLTDSAKKYGAEILPIDSEHSALFQCLKVGKVNEVEKLILTASGGAFYKQDFNTLNYVTPEMAVKHPTWKMGAKISVDSATMMNKGLELIEAKYLYDIDKVDYVLHPESIIHSLVEYVDGSTIAQLSYPNMELAILYALTYPDKKAGCNVRPFDFKRPLTFLEKNETFVAPELAQECLRVGGSSPIIYNCANEVAVELFLEHKISFCDIINIVKQELNSRVCEYNYDMAHVINLYEEIKLTIKSKYK